MEILIEVNSNIGDLVMNIPIINYLKKIYPDCKIDIIADKKSFNLLTETSNINKIYLKEKNKKAKILLFWNLLKNRYDLAIGLRSDAVPLLIRAKKKLYKSDRDKNLFDKQSETLYHFSILNKMFEVSQEDINTTIEFSDASLKYVKNLIDYKEKEKILCIAPGANFVLKIWAKENFIELINQIKSKFDKVIIVGAPSENDICEEIAIKTNSINLAGKTNLVQAAALLSLNNLFVGNDSGLGHISAAMGVNTLSIFAHANPDRYTPFRQKSISRPDKEINKIRVDEVIEKLNLSNFL